MSAYARRCGANDLDSIRLDSSRIGVACSATPITITLGTSAALSDDRYFIVSSPTLTLFATERRVVGDRDRGTRDITVYFTITLKAACPRNDGLTSTAASIFRQVSYPNVE